MELKISEKQKKGSGHFIRKAQKWQEKTKWGWKKKGGMADLPQSVRSFGGLDIGFVKRVRERVRLEKGNVKRI